MLSRTFTVSLCTLAYPLGVYCPPWRHPTILSIFNLIRSSRKHSLEAKVIGANEALDYLWVLSIPLISDPLNSISNSVLDDANSHSDWEQLICFSWLFAEHIAPVPVSAGALFFGPTGWQLSRQLLAVKAWGSDHRHLAMAYSRVTRLNARKSKSWRESDWGPNHQSFHFMNKSKCFRSLHYLQYSGFQTSTRCWGPAHHREQFSELCTEFTRKFTQ